MWQGDRQYDTGWLLGLGSWLSLISCLLVLAKELIPYGTSPSRFVLRRTTVWQWGSQPASQAWQVATSKNKRRVTYSPCDNGQAPVVRDLAG